MVISLGVHYILQRIIIMVVQCQSVVLSMEEQKKRLEDMQFNSLEELEPLS